MKKKDRIFIAFSFIFFLLVAGGIVYKIEREKWIEKQNKAEYVTSSQVNKLQYILDTLLLKTQTLEMLVIQSGGKVVNEGKLEDFGFLAQYLYDNEAIRSLQLAPDGVVTYVYPLEGNENAFVDLFHDPERRTEAEAARDSRKLTLSGPYELYQGGFGMIARRPIYLPYDGGDKFWGFAIIVLDLPEAFQPARLDMFVKEGFEYKLYRIHPDTKKIQIIDESSENILKDPVEESFLVPNGIWTFSVMPKEGWIRKRDVLFETILAFMIAFMLTFILAFMIKMKRQQQSLYYSSITDSLTQLYNYSKFISTLEEYIRDKKTYVLFFMDLNGFKAINDTYGHNAGNEVLIESAKRLIQCFYGKENVFRNGGDEFCAIVEGNMGLQGCEEKARLVTERIKEPVQIEDKMVQCGISIGYARYPDDSDNMERLIQKADEMMYCKKLYEKTKIQSAKISEIKISETRTK